jgi:tetratricopeptide (TPR) repeat protein
VSRRGCVAAAVLVIAALPAAAQAPDPTARRLYSAGLQAYGAGRYDVAIRAFEAAYARAPADLLVFDLAQAYRKKFIADGDAASLDKAIELYRKFLASSATGRERAVAGDALGDLIVVAARRGAAVGAPPAAAAPAERAPERTEIMIVSDAQGAEVALDGRPPSPAPLLDTVAPGEHRGHVTAPGYAAADVHVTAVEGRFVVSEARLTPLPGALQLSGRRGAEVEIDAQPAGVLPLDKVALPSGTHHVKLTLRGYQPWNADLVVERGAALAVDAKLAPTRQRRAVRWLGGAASLFGAAAIASGAVWIDADQEASALYQQQMHGQITLADKRAYDAARARRDDAMVGTSVTLAVGGALALTSVVLYLFDHR